jgi:branched-chain amino acid aminotransferase
MPGSQDSTADPRNAARRIYLNGALVPPEEAKVSVFDAGFVLGDGVWEGLRLHNGALLFLDEHLDRLFASAQAIGLDIGMTRSDLIAAIRVTLDANGMQDGVHVRLMVTRGEKRAANQDPRNALGRPTLVIVAEYKQPSPLVASRGLSLFTASIRCTPREMFDMRINSHSRLNLIMALNEAISAGADEALMLDPMGFVSSCNATNFFFVTDGEVRTSRGAYCFNGITRANVIALCRENAIPIRIGDFPVENVHGAEEAFVTGTFGGITPVRSIDGNVLRLAIPGPATRRLRVLYEKLKDCEAVRQDA